MKLEDTEDYEMDDEEEEDDEGYGAPPMLNIQSESCPFFPARY